MTAQDTPAEDRPRVDVRRVMAEIDADVRRRRQTGELPPDLERELDTLFAQYAPVGAVKGDFGQVVARVEKVSFVDVAVPVGSRQPGVSYVKRLLKKMMSWYLNYVAMQVSAFAHATTRALRILGDRVERIEADRVEGPGAELAAAARAAVPAGTAEMTWADVVVDHCRGVTGRVVHGECGDGALLGLLAAAAVDVYGIEPDHERAARAEASGREVRIDEVVDHLRVMADGALGGIVLSGAVDRLPRGALLELATMLATRVAPGGRVVVVSSEPEAWARRHPIEADLAPGRPLRAETWAFLLAQQGLTGVEVHGPQADSYAVTALRP